MNSNTTSFNDYEDYEDGFEYVRLRRRTGIEESMRTTLRRTDPLLDEENVKIEHLSHAKSLLSVRELASSVLNTRPSTSRKFSLENCCSIRRRRNKDTMLIDAETIRGLEDMGLPESILDRLRSGWIDPLTQIQIQGLSVAISGRDLVGISFTGSGSTLMYVLPLVRAALQEHVFMPILQGEGPFGLILCPSTELATHTFQLVAEFVAVLKENGQPELRAMLCVDGKGLRLEMIKRGVHMIVATPDKLNLMLVNKTMTLDSCRYLALDKADLLLDTKFEHDIQSILGRIKGQRQTVLFCSNMTPRVQNFAEHELVKPVTVDAGTSDLTENVNAITIDNL